MMAVPEQKVKKMAEDGLKHLHAAQPVDPGHQQDRYLHEPEAPFGKRFLATVLGQEPLEME